LRKEGVENLREAKVEEERVVLEEKFYVLDFSRVV
jgi:hypothetical protein